MRAFDHRRPLFIKEPLRERRTQYPRCRPQRYDNFEVGKKGESLEKILGGIDLVFFRIYGRLDGSPETSGLLVLFAEIYNIMVR